MISANFFTSAEFGGIGSIATIIALFLSIGFFVAGLKRRKLICRIEPVATELVKTGQSSKLSVSYNGTQITSDVTAKLVSVWSAGRLPIRSTEVQRPVRIVVVGEVPILEATIRAASREVIKAALVESDLASGKLGLDWAILEKDDGITVQLIYAGDAKAEITMDGIIEGRTVPKVLSNRASLRYELGWYLCAVGCGLLATIITNHWFATQRYPSGIYNFKRIVTEEFMTVNFEMQFKVWWAFISWPVCAVLVVRTLINGSRPLPPKTIRL